MKKLSFKISKGLKTALVVSSLMGIALCSSKHTAKAATTFAFVGLVAGLKQRNLWENLDDNTKAFAEESDKQAKDLHQQLTELKNAKEAVDKAMKEAAEKSETSDKDLKELQETAKKLALQLDEVKNRAANAFEKSEIAKALVQHKEGIEKFVKSKTGTYVIEVKASQTATDIETHTIGAVVPGIGQLPVRKPVIASLFPTVNVNMEYVKYRDQKTVVRDAKNVAGCATSTHNTKIVWKEYSIQIQKVRDFVDICFDMMEDYDFVEGEIRNLLDTSVNLKVDSQLLLGDGEAPNLNSIDLAASEFDASNTLTDTITPWANTVKDPNLYDVVIAMASQIVSLGQDNMYIPDTVLVNTVDQFKNMVLKTEEGQYLTVPFVGMVNNKMATIDSMRVVTSPLIPANTCYVFDSTKGTVYNRRGITIEMAFENNDNFETETVTMKAYRRLNLLIRNVNANAFMKCSDVTAAIAALEKAV